MINKIHEWPLRLILNDHTSDFDTVLQNSNDTCNHHRNIQTLMVKIYKIKNNLNPMFERRKNTYNQRNFQEFATKRKRTVKMDLKTLNKALGNGYVLTIRADYVNFTCQTLGFCSIYLLLMYIHNHPTLA